MAIDGAPMPTALNTIMQAMTTQQQNALNLVLTQNSEILEMLVTQVRQEPVGSN